MFKKKNHDKRFEVFRQMPPLTHKPGETYNPNDSEVLAWIKEQPDLLIYLMETARRRGLIAFKDGKWSGVPAEGSGE
jgi:hypothetical protein